MNNIEYFIGKICTVHTDFLSQTLTSKQMFAYFTGYVKSINEYGVVIERITGKHLTFIMLKNIVAITEEEVEELNPENPKDAKIIESVKATQQKLDKTVTGEFVNPDDLEQISKLMKNFKN